MSPVDHRLLINIRARSSHRRYDKLSPDDCRSLRGRSQEAVGLSIAAQVTKESGCATACQSASPTQSSMSLVLKFAQAASVNTVR